MSDSIVLKGVPPSEQIIDTVASESNGKVLLAFSCGKDSIASWIALKRRGVKVIPYYYYIHPDLEFINKSLDYYEEFFGERIYRVPAPGVYRMWRNLVFQPPERIGVVMGTRIPKFNHDDLARAVKITAQVPASTWVGLGIRAADSVNRRTSFVRTGAAVKNKLKFYPVWDWKKQRLRVELYREKVKLPPDYWIFGRTFDGLDYRFVGPLKKH